jgi:hypothetical protein
MEVTVITEFGRTISSDNRYRRSERVRDALAFQCAHLQEQMGLEAMVVSDDNGSAWVGSGDLALCRVLSRSAPSLARPDHDDRELQMKTLQALRGDLNTSQVATMSIPVPGSRRHIYVAGVGRNRLLENGVQVTGVGAKRILGFQRPAPATPAVGGDTNEVLDRLVRQAWNTQLTSGNTEREGSPRNWMGIVDDSVYAPVLADVLAPALAALELRSVVATSLWRHYRLRTNEVELTDGLYLRTLSCDLLHAQHRVRLGRLEVDLYHRHDRVVLPVCPRLRLNWG